MDHKRKHSRKEEARPLQFVGVKILIPVFFALLVLLICLVFGLTETGKLANQYAEETAELYVSQFNRDILQINNELIQIMDNDRGIQSLPDRMDSVQTEYYDLLRRIMDQNLLLKLRYCEVEEFFIYGEEADVLIGDGGTVFHDSTAEGMLQSVKEFCRFGVKDCKGVVQWDFIETDGKVWPIGWYAKNGRMMCCTIRLDTIFSNLREMPRGYQVISFLKKPDGSLVLSEECGEDDLTRVQESKKCELYQYQLGTLGKICVYVIPDGGILENILEMQAVLVVAIILLLLVCAFWAYWYYYRGLLKPIDQFVQEITDMGEEIPEKDWRSSILELEHVSERFRELLRKIQGLKIAVYEKELSRQKTELEYMQEQIRPHFTLNCLSLIHGIADARGEEQITYITEELSEYIRYNYRDSAKERNLREELAHVKIYVDLQRMRYGKEDFEFEVIEDGLEGDYYIPPLMLQTLVENSFVHAVSLDDPVDISLYMTCEIYGEDQYLYISVSDTGRGFPREILEAFEQNLPIEYGGRRHIGLQNIKRRLQILYGDGASMTIQNMDEHYGAVTEVRILQKKKK